jgi:hypothetical protein
MTSEGGRRRLRAADVNSLSEDQLRGLRRGVLANTLAWFAAILLLAGGLYLQDQRDAQRQRDICGLMTTLDVPLPSSPPPSPGPALQRQQKILKEIHDYRARIGCPS